MKVIVDAMGGDNAPKEIVKGCIDAVKEYGIKILLVGKKDVLEEELKAFDYPKEDIEILDAQDIITNDDDPALAIRRKKDSSLVVGLKALVDGLGDGFISAGSTGALLAGGLFIVKRIPGIDRAALTSIYPTNKGISLLVDAGANVDCKAEYLRQFSVMASIYMEKVMDRPNPSLGLVNIGLEEGKGNQLAKEAYELIKNTNLNFIGNIEGRDIPLGDADIIIADGFVGNVVLKLTEGMASSIFSHLKKALMADSRSKLGAVLLKPQLNEMKKLMDYREYGGAPLLGTRKPVVKAHGSSDALAFKNGIRQLISFVENDVIKTISDNFLEVNENQED